MRKPTLVERIRFHRRDARLIGFTRREGWRGELPVYERNGKQYLEQGFEKRLEEKWF